MNRSILVTMAIAVVAIGLALVFSQTSPGQAVLTKLIHKNESTESAAPVVADESNVAEVVEEGTLTEEAAAEPEGEEIVEGESTAPAGSDYAKVMEEDKKKVAAADAGETDQTGMTPVDLGDEKVRAAYEEEENKEIEPKTAAAEAKEAPIKLTYKVDVAAAMKDRSIGSPDAPVTVYDFSSLTCPHCAHFHNEILPKVKKYYIDTGKVRWVFKGFPLNEPALKAEMVARCAPEDQYIKLIDLMYENQSRWAFDDQALGNLAMFLRLAGVSEDMFMSCAGSTDLQTAYITEVQANAEKYKVESTPTFIFNDGAKKISGAGTYEGFANDLDVMIKQAEAAKSTPATDKK